MSFLILDKGKVFAKCLNVLLNDDSEHLKKATSEIVLYILKSETILGTKLWKVLDKEVITPNLVLLESAVTETDPLLAWLKKRYSEIGHLEGNLRLLLTSKVECVRKEAQGCLRTILSRQPNSETKIPRFSTILAQDLTALSTDISPIALNLRRVFEENATHDIKNLLDFLDSSPDYEIIGRQSALDNLLVNLSDPRSNREFLDHHGIEKIARFLDKCLDERCAQLLVLYPLALSVLTRSLKHTLGKIEDGSTKNSLLFSHLRGLFVFSNRENPDVLQKIIANLALMLYHPWLDCEDGINLTLPACVIKSINFPLHVLEEAPQPPSTQ